MDYLAKGREVIRSVLLECEQADARQPKPHVFSSAIMDAQRDVYAYVSWGWSGKHRVHSTYLLVRIFDGRFWVEEDWSKEGIATELLEAGVPNDKIVLAFHHPSMREYTEFAVA